MLIYDKITRLADKAGWAFEYYKEHSKAVFHSDYSSFGFHLDLNMPDIEVYEYIKESMEDFSCASDDFYRRRAIISKERATALEAQQKLIKVLQDAVNEDEKYVAIKKIAEKAGWEAEYTGIPKAPNLWAQLTFTREDHTVSTPMSWGKPLYDVLVLLKNDLLKGYNEKKALNERFAKQPQKCDLREKRHRAFELDLIRAFENALKEE